MTKNKKNIVGLALGIFLIGVPNLSLAANFVDSYYRSDPDSNPFNNYSFPGNTNPYTGKTATGNEETYLSNYYNIKTSNDEDSLLKTLNPDSLQRVFITTPIKSESEKLLEEQGVYFNNLEKERSDVDKRLYELRQQNTIFSKCVNPVPVGCSTESDYSSKYAINSRSGLLSTEMSKNELASCRTQIDTYQAAKTQYDQCRINVQNEAINSIADKEAEIARLQKESDYYQSLLVQARNSAQVELNSQQNSCVKEHGPYSAYSRSSNQCQCQPGMAPDSLTPFKCIPIEMFCKIESGVGATNRRTDYLDDVPKFVNSTCIDGYEWDQGTDKCEVRIQEVKAPESSEMTQGGLLRRAGIKIKSPERPKDTAVSDNVPIKSPSNTTKKTESRCGNYGIYSDLTPGCEQLSSSLKNTEVPNSYVATSTTIEKNEQVIEKSQNKSAQGTRVKNQTIIQRIRSLFLSFWW